MVAADDGYDIGYESNPSFCIRAIVLKLIFVDVKSGSGVSPSRYCMTCLMPGLKLADGCEHSSPSFSTRHASSVLQSPCNLRSTVSLREPFLKWSRTQSTNISWLYRPLSSLTGLCPQVISRRNAPNVKTSVSLDALPVHISSGAKYPIVPTTCVVWGSVPWSYNLESPKSPKHPFI
ncbi:Os07g0262700 [Oryza sativa Japonica Group]|uniref:Os07g0262700 protein n=1 Tax=Oryza sativa subsp. japonica TaxID=39947 RepID=A0A0P0X4Z3_ORYSJ|nr:hypothetical protein EE612_038347 [Oryza sativa]BAT00902.1 Os07g0262700 [Oryza sativa Japonica Group]